MLPLMALKFTISSQCNESFQQDTFSEEVEQISFTVSSAVLGRRSVSFARALSTQLMYRWRCPKADLPVMKLTSREALSWSNTRWEHRSIYLIYLAVGPTSPGEWANYDQLLGPLSHDPLGHREPQLFA